jgi:hypothetical protein
VGEGEGRREGLLSVTVIELRAIAALRSVRMPPKNWHARCVFRLDSEATANPGRALGVTEAADLWFLVWRYRRQIADADVVTYADELVNGARSLAF